MRSDVRIPVQYSEVIERAKRNIAKHFGGYTAYEAEGGWIDDSGDLIEDRVVVIETYHQDREKLRSEFEHIILMILDQTDEDAIMYVIDGQKRIVS